MKAILDKIIDLCYEKINDMSMAIQCHIMHERDGRTLDYSAHFEMLGVAYIVKSEMESFKEDIDNIVNNLTLHSIDEWKNPLLSDNYFENEEEFAKMDVYELLLWKYLSDDNLLLMTNPSKYSTEFIEQHFALKKAISEGFKKFFPNIDLKKMTITEDGENVFSEWTEKDENNKITGKDLEKIGLIAEFESFISKANSLKNALIAKVDPFDVLVFIRDN